MTELVNLNRFRKNKARADKTARATENTVRFGRTKAEKTLETVIKIKTAQDWSGKKRET